MHVSESLVVGYRLGGVTTLSIMLLSKRPLGARHNTLYVPPFQEVDIIEKRLNPGDLSIRHELSSPTSEDRT